MTTRASKSVGAKGATLRSTVTRRTVLKGATAAGAALGMGPWIVKDAYSSSGELNILMWSDYLVKPVADGFTRKTGPRGGHPPVPPGALFPPVTEYSQFYFMPGLAVGRRGNTWQRAGSAR